jgi:hypothetical protein
MIIFDEKKFAENMIKKGFQTKHKNINELNILSKYYFSMGMEIDEVKEQIIKFCEKHVEYFNMDEWYKVINKTIEIAQKGKLVTGKVVSITEEELNQIKEIDKINEQKLTFVMLVLYKFYDYKKFEISVEDLYRLCKLNINSQTKLKLLQSLTSKELIDITMGGKRWVKFADKKGKSVISIANFEDFIFEYLNYIGEEGFGECNECNKAIKIRGKNHKMCSTCLEKSKKESWKVASKKYREKNKTS